LEKLPCCDKVAGPKKEVKETGLRARLPEAAYSEQLEEIMRTVSTFSFGWLPDMLLDADGAGLAGGVPAVDGGLLVDPLIDLSSVPVISTLWPTCALSFASSASSRYVLPLAPLADDPAAELGDVAPAVPVGFVAVEVVGLPGVDDAAELDEPDELMVALARM